MLQKLYFHVIHATKITFFYVIHAVKITFFHLIDFVGSEFSPLNFKTFIFRLNF